MVRRAIYTSLCRRIVIIICCRVSSIPPHVSVVSAQYINLHRASENRKRAISPHKIARVYGQACDLYVSMSPRCHNHLLSSIIHPPQVSVVLAQHINWHGASESRKMVILPHKIARVYGQACDIYVPMSPRCHNHLLSSIIHRPPGRGGIDTVHKSAYADKK
jgi:hypothetical protein